MAKKKNIDNLNLPQEALARARAELAAEKGKPVEEISTKAASEKVIKKTSSAQHVSSFKRTMTRDELQAEYGYVLADLKSMALLALLLFIGMVAVSLTIESLI